MSEAVGQTRRHRFPAVRSGGLFLLLMGLGILAADLFSGAATMNTNIFYLGTGLALMSFFSVRKLAFGRSSAMQIGALMFAILLEMALMVTYNRMLGPMGQEERWLWAFLIVGLHFLPMGLTFGPQIFALGLLCMANAALGLLAGLLPFDAVAVIDGALNLGFGAWMLMTKPDGRPALAARAS